MNLATGTRLLLALSVSSALLTAQAPETPDASPVASASGAFVALSVPDLPASIAWYQRTFGLKQTHAIPAMGPIAGGALLEGQGLVVELLQHRDAKPGTTPAELTHGVAKAGVVVADFDATVAALRSRGVVFAAGPYPARPGQRPGVMFKDNAGNMWQILGPLLAP